MNQNPYRVLDYPNGFISEWIAGKFPDGYRGHAIDIGASDGISVNNTYHLERAHRWTVLSVEANPKFLPLIRKHRTWYECCACAAEPIDEATFYVNPLQPEVYSALKVPGRPRIIVNGQSCESEKPANWEQIKVPVRTVDQLLDKWSFPKLDLLSIDVEGGERDVLMGCDLLRWKPKWIVSESWEPGGEHVYLSTYGYQRVARCAHNDIYMLVE